MDMGAYKWRYGWICMDMDRYGWLRVDMDTQEMPKEPQRDPRESPGRPAEGQEAPPEAQRQGEKLRAGWGGPAARFGKGMPIRGEP